MADTQDYEIPEQLELEWRALLRCFKEQIYPAFAEYGIDYGTALMIFKVDSLGGEIHQLIDELEDHNGL